MSTLPGSGGKDGIRTHGRLATSTVFETAPFVRSGTLPFRSIAAGGGEGGGRGGAGGGRAAGGGGGEEGAEQGGPVVGQDAAVDLDPVGEAGVADQVEQGGDGAGLGVVGAEDEGGDPGLDQGAGAHGAGFEGDHQ